MTRAAVLLAGLAAGCGGPDLYDVRGRVTLNGEPVEKGVVRFVPADPNRSAEAGTIRDGAYTARVPPGTLRVEITASRVEPDAPVVEGTPAARALMPPRYNTASALTVEVGPGRPTEFDFPLTVTPAEEAALKVVGAPGAVLK
ncbi:MAG: hypothetical protein C0501_29815 [Isosphaera sp.]|nr:hypothetical protein [Isosphaera sp.]